MMKHDWYFYNKIYSNDECREIVDLVKRSTAENFKDIGAKGKDVHVDIIDTSKVKDRLSKFFNLVHETNEDVFGFNLYPNGPRTMNLNTYTTHQKEYPYHKDAAINGSARDVKLTAVLNLSYDHYTGGEFDFFMGDEIRAHEIDICGALIIFPSFLYHRVRPVTSGTRITLAGWFSGPNWK